MGIKLKGGLTVDTIKKYLDKCIDIINFEVSQTLSHLGEECVGRIRDRSGEDSWFDHSGNLRSSVGYRCQVPGYKFKDGKDYIESNFAQVLNGADGSEKGRKMVRDLAAKYETTYSLILVAAMEYADRVEALDNKDVLASTELWVRSVIDERLNKTKAKILRRINEIKL